MRTVILVIGFQDERDSGIHPKKYIHKVIQILFMWLLKKEALLFYSTGFLTSKGCIISGSRLYYFQLIASINQKKVVLKEKISTFYEA
jgi:hypothetical protein